MNVNFNIDLTQIIIGLNIKYKYKNLKKNE